MFCVSLAVFVLLCTGMGQAETYEDEQVIWTPNGNQSLKNKDRGDALFQTDEVERIVSLIAVSKSDSLLTVDAYKEMIAFEEALFAVSELDDTRYDDETNEITRPGKGNPYTLADICE